jgi:hypothetical protein
MCESESKLKRTFKVWCPDCKEYLVDLRHDCVKTKADIKIVRKEGACVCGKPGNESVQVISC